MLFKSPLGWGILVAVLIAVQVGLSYLSFQSFLRGDWLESILLFLGVLIIGFLMGIGFFRFQQQRKNL